MLDHYITLDLVKTAFDLRSSCTRARASRARDSFYTMGIAAATDSERDEFFRLAEECDQITVACDGRHFKNGRAPGPTPEAMLKRLRFGNADQIERMYERGLLNVDQHRAAGEIRWMVRAVGRDVGVKTMTFAPSAGGGRAPMTNESERLAWMRFTIYLPWCDALGPLETALCLATIAYDEAISSVARRRHTRNEGAVRALCDALDLWGDLKQKKGPTAEAVEPKVTGNF